jgi:hypothetical protein
MVVIIIIVVILLAIPVAMYVRARQVVSIDVHSLTLDEIVETGTKTSESAIRRLRGRAQVENIPGMAGAVAWQARNSRVYTMYAAVPLESGTGYRVGAGVGKADKLYKMFSITDMEAAHRAGRRRGDDHGAAGYVGGQMGTWLGQKLWLWSSSRTVLYRRWRTLGALKRADERKMAVVAPGPGAAQIS